jgi:hypothetical protein
LTPARNIGDAVAKLDRLVDVVADHDHRLVQLTAASGRTRSESISRLIGSTAPNGSSISSSGAIGGQCADHADTLLLAARQFSRIALQILLRFERDHRSSVPWRGRGISVLSQPSRRGTTDDVLLDGHVREQADLLDHVADVAAQRRLRSDLKCPRR